MSVFYFAWLRERMGRDSDALTFPAGTTAGVVLAHLAAAHPATFGADGRIRAAVNQTVAPMTTVLKDGDEVAFFPPMTGG